MEAVIRIALNDLASTPRQSRNSRSTSCREKVVKIWYGWWHRIFLISCMIAVLVDPLFLYIPIIDEGNKCLRMDKKVMTASLLLRSLTDITFVLHIVYQIYGIFTKQPVNRRSIAAMFLMPKEEMNREATKAQRLPWLSILTDFLSVLPIPQVLIIVAFFKIRDTGHLDGGDILNFFLLAQYVPRIYRIHLLSRKIARINGFLVKIIFYFFLYILASHVIGAFWYFLSIQREMSCWNQACMKHNTCSSSLHCHDNGSSRNIALLDEFCPINSPNATVFDFGIFLDSLRSNNKGSINFPMRLLFSIWWAMRNLSSFGSNLATSNYVWENCFAILVSAIGLPIFFYLVGTKVETLQKKQTEKENARSNEIKRRRQIQEGYLKFWTLQSRLPDNLRKDILTYLKENFDVNKEANMENVFSALPWRTRKALKLHLCMHMLKQVPRLEGMVERVLEKMCERLKPVTYMENSYIFRAGEPLDSILLVKSGIIWTYSNTCHPSASSINTFLDDGAFYGHEQLLSWASSSETALSFSTLPISKENVKCHTKAEGFILLAKDLKTVALRYRHLWRFSNDHNNLEASKALKSVVSAAIRRRRLARARQQSLM